MSKRISALRDALKREKLDGFVTGQPANVRYLCGYTGSNGLVLVTRRGAWFYTDFRYAEQVRTEVKGCRRRVLKRDLYSSFPASDTAGARRIGVEKDHLSLARFKALRKGLKGRRLVPVHDMIKELRRTKDSTEVKLIQQSQAVVDRVFRQVLPMIKPGVTEQDLALEIDFAFRRAGGEHSFESTVASGPNGAKPHAGYSRRRVRPGDAITFDIGCRLNGYCTDMTRTVFVGKARGELRLLYEIVLEAQRRAVEAVRPGVKAMDVDAAARGYIKQAGYDKYFGHSTGHGVGIEVHERPVLSTMSKDVLAPGDVVTVEPGIYLPGIGGVRIEDMVLVLRTGHLVLTKSPKDLLEL